MATHTRWHALGRMVRRMLPLGLLALSLAPLTAAYAAPSLGETAPPTCDKKSATIWVDANGVIHGGPDTGKVYGDVKRLNGTSNMDVIVGSDAPEVIYGYDSADSICGRGGDDQVNGGTGFDTIFGDFGNDTLNGEAGSDWVFGGAGDDQVNGGPGDDWLLGGWQNDLLAGGLGHDKFSGGEDPNDPGNTDLDRAKDFQVGIDTDYDHSVEVGIPAQ